ncbi:tyrosine-type recombinase/integrase [Hoeflea sp.]|uniref:tyrosine-type recombinase/integrase n=1 Tax=Hoeflea sp. TaxID=1940281 RepID=UPI003A93203D
MKRSFWWRCFKANYVYGVNDIMNELGVCRNTVSNHIKQGLRPIDPRVPLLFAGSELIRFYKDRMKSRNRARGPGEFNCLRCKTFVLPNPQTIQIVERSIAGQKRFPLAMAVCPDCSGKLSRIISETECDKIGRAADSKFNRDSIDEYAAQFPAEIGNQPALSDPVWNQNNERLKYDLIIYCRQFNRKTTDAIMLAVRELEIFLGQKDFRRYNIEDIDRYRTELRRRLTASGADRLSLSTVAHRASHVRRFLEWLILQVGMENLPRSLPDYTRLSKADTARASKPEPRPYPTDEEAVLLVSAMPIRSLVELRDQAIVATSFLLGTRANATASLRVKHIDLEKRCAYQVATEIRVKNSKTQTTFFFPGDPIFEQKLTRWIQKLEALGATAEDALFPPDEDLHRASRWHIVGRTPIVPWATSSSIEKAFRRASEAAELPYFNPHSARHNVFLRRDNYCSNWRQRKAWSHNGGHESEAITERNYAKVTDEECRQIFSEFADSNGETLEDKDLMLDYYSSKLVPGTPEHKRASMLVRARMDRG